MVNILLVAFNCTYFLWSFCGAGFVCAEDCKRLQKVAEDVCSDSAFENSVAIQPETSVWFDIGVELI